MAKRSTISGSQNGAKIVADCTAAGGIVGGLCGTNLSAVAIQLKTGTNIVTATNGIIYKRSSWKNMVHFFAFDDYDKTSLSGYINIVGNINNDKANGKGIKIDKLKIDNKELILTICGRNPDGSSEVEKKGYITCFDQDNPSYDYGYVNVNYTLDEVEEIRTDCSNGVTKILHPNYRPLMCFLQEDENGKEIIIGQEVNFPYGAVREANENMAKRACCSVGKMTGEAAQYTVPGDIVYMHFTYDFYTPGLLGSTVGFLSNNSECERWVTGMSIKKKNPYVTNDGQLYFALGNRTTPNHDDISVDQNATPPTHVLPHAEDCFNGWDGSGNEKKIPYLWLNSGVGYGIVVVHPTKPDEFPNVARACNILITRSLPPSFTKIDFKVEDFNDGGVGDTGICMPVWSDRTGWPKCGQQMYGCQFYAGGRSLNQIPKFIILYNKLFMMKLNELNIIKEFFNISGYTLDKKTLQILNNIKHEIYEKALNIWKENSELMNDINLMSTSDGTSKNLQTNDEHYVSREGRYDDFDLYCYIKQKPTDKSFVFQKQMKQGSEIIGYSFDGSRGVAFYGKGAISFSGIDAEKSALIVDKADTLDVNPNIQHAHISSSLYTVDTSGSMVCNTSEMLMKDSWTSHDLSFINPELLNNFKKIIVNISANTGIFFIKNTGDMVILYPPNDSGKDYYVNHVVIDGFKIIDGCEGRVGGASAIFILALSNDEIVKGKGKSLVLGYKLIGEDYKNNFNIDYDKYNYLDFYNSGRFYTEELARMIVSKWSYVVPGAGVPVAQTLDPRARRVSFAEILGNGSVNKIKYDGFSGDGFVGEGNVTRIHFIINANVENIKEFTHSDMSRFTITATSLTQENKIAT